MRGLRPAPVVASFSSRGPRGPHREHPQTRHHGTWCGHSCSSSARDRSILWAGAPGNSSSAFRIKSGTSMACPHVIGAMAFIKSVHPQWSFFAINSTLMTTALTSNNTRRIVTNTSKIPANPHQVGVGEMRPMKALDPDLVIETTVVDHLYFHCYKGYKQRTVRAISGTNFTCPRGSREELNSSLNYPTIYLDCLQGPRKVKRVATNVGPPNATYVASVNAPPGLVVRIAPRKIVFGQGVSKASFKVFFDGKATPKGYNFGDVRWFDGSHVVRIVFAVNVD